MKKRYENVTDLHPQGKKLGSVGVRPNLSIAFVFVFGIFLIAMFPNAVGIVSGLLVMALSLAYLFGVKEHPILDVYERQLLVYDEKDPAKAMMIDKDDVKEYFIARSDSTDIDLRLNDGEVLVLHSMQKNKAYSLLSKVLPDKASDDMNLKNRKRFFSKKDH